MKIGIILSLIGLGFLLREAAVRGWVDLTIEMRLAAATVFGLAMLAFGWHQRTKRPIYGLSLQGGGIAVLYLVTLASYALYELVGAPVALAAVVLITVAAGALAMVQNSLTLAMLGLVGGFSAPLLAFAWPQDHFEVFGFYAVLGVAVVAVSRLKAWPTLVLSGYAFTFVVAGLWLLARQDDSDWVQLQPFVAFFVLLYALVPLVWPPVASSRPEPIGFKDAWNAPLVFCTPFAGLAMQALLVGHMRYGVAISSAVLALAHVALRELARNLRPADKQIVVAYTALAVAFSATAVPLFLGASATSAIWAVQGAVLVWASARWGSRLALVGGAVLQAAAAVAYVVRIAAASTAWDSPAVFGFWAEATPVFNVFSLGAVVLAACGLASAEFLRRSSHLEDWHPWPQNVALVWGAGWFLFAETAAVWLRLGLMPAVGLWAVQGAALMWVASKRRSMPVAVVGITMQVIAAVAAALKMADDAANLSPGSFEFWADSTPFANQYFGVAVLLAACGIASAVIIHRSASALDNARVPMMWLSLLWGVGWWLFAAAAQLWVLTDDYRLWALSLLVIGTASAVVVAGRALKWDELEWAGVLMLPTLAVALAIAVISKDSPSADWGWTAWPFMILAYAVFLRTGGDKLKAAGLYGGLYCVVSVFLAAEVYGQLAQVADGEWPLYGAGAAVLLWLEASLLARRHASWFVGDGWRSCLLYGITPAAWTAAAGAAIAVVRHHGSVDPLPFVPILNPIDIFATAAVLVMLRWRREMVAELSADSDGLTPAVASLLRVAAAPWLPALSAGGVAALTMTAARSVHHWADVPFELRSLVYSTELQVAVSILWAATALAAMVVGVRAADRRIWIVGASWMGVVVVKLFLIDLANLATLPKAASFIGVGFLLLIVGYLAPVPPAQAKDEEPVDETDDEPGMHGGSLTGGADRGQEAR
ncbi:DUF2339 domain-containing protein [Candidatus Poriferisodalis sp.]|uniref:DUF2339 domain-containing protein n=1 Tax=Candidatus Poriferisodalis sp. TaxID=3101277 RepID=UPI003B5AA074